MKTKRGILFLVSILFLFFTLPAGATEKPYLIGTGDVLEISVWKDESLSRTLIVPPDRIIAFPLIGDVNVAGLSVGELRDIIKKKLSDYVPDATVTVLLREINSLRGYVIGKANKPGVFPITMDTSVMQILSMAGGLNPFASETQIHILRHEKGKTVKIPFSYKEVLRGDNLDQNIFLKTGDVIVVP
jgi:polysaccharide biosynthesis/export protein